ncbi:TolB protein [Kribbella orskensis]|uniref:TolB protein n=1 Tax=Kribbella orskensis TaxID=2512216 RepID=A0ABY2BDQ9_9ACTN|nr:MULTISPECIES: PD40 domain-containing protein [Kribbella]TCN33597.1 TolB protein [Kribbella sp. VKM Ac-2500]TCO13996.1 TolB protein [Kribbella orskensis]
MRGSRKLFIAVVAVVLVVVPGTSAYAAAPAPGGRILYVDLESRLKSVLPTGQGGQDIGERLVYSPDYSPDGTRIAYLDGWSFRIMAADGTDDRWLVDAASGPAYPRWSPDGQWIIAESAGDIWSVSKDGYASGWTNLTGAHDSNDLVPTWEPKGHRFATSTYNDVRIYSADGAHTRKVIPMAGAYRLDWNPKENQLAVEALGDLWLVDVASGAIRRLTNTPDLQELSPVWSPDGRWLTYGRGPGVYNPDNPGLGVTPVIWMMDSTGGHRHSLGISGTPSSWRAAS